MKNYLLKVSQEVTENGQGYSWTRMVAFPFAQLDDAVKVAKSLLYASTEGFRDGDGNRYEHTKIWIEQTEGEQAEETKGERVPDPLGVDD